MGQDGHDGGQALPDRLLAPGQIDDEGGLPDAGDRPAEDGRRGPLGPRPAHGLGEARGLALDDAFCGLGGPVARAEAGPARRQDEVETLVRPGDEDRPDLVRLVGDDLRPDDLASRGFDHLSDGWAAPVLAFAPRSLVAHGQYADLHRHPPILNISLVRPSIAPRSQLFLASNASRIRASISAGPP